MRPEIETNPFNAFEEKVAFFRVEGEAPFGENVADTREIEDEGERVVGEEEHVIDDLAVAVADEVDGDLGDFEVREMFAEEGLPFLPKEEHESGVASGSVDRSEGHNVEGVQLAVGACEAEFVAVRVADADLVETGFGVDADPIEAAGARSEVVNSLVTAGDGKVVDEGDGVEAAVGDAETPDEVGNVGDVFLMGFGGEDDHGEPASEVGETADPA